jgi:anti-sigma regulatory factor (Ser/Thr protein kinase)
MATAADSPTVSLTMPAKPDYVVLARLALSAVCRLTPLGADDVADLKLAITEAAALLMATDPSADESGPIGFAFELEDERLALTVHGPPVQPSANGPDPDERELSHAILRATADDCDIGERSVRLVKYLRPSAE